ncbi:hypothetical protein GCM10008939_14610 [Deinococcus aquiradiocola]|uniref:Cytosine-specific methyltransferase n=2 Tax=Deinococcus aquiradiocola TaxID=393059 RepID=A0A917PD74_9DEIO|nr:hypothetical protein GCM10008939_14610 [Deinococcus aquiradiocola]
MGGRGLHDGYRGQVLSAADRRWRQTIERFMISEGFSAPEARERRHRIEQDVTTLTSALEALYGTRSLGNFADPVAEVIFMILSRRGKITAALRVMDELLGMPGGLRSILNMDLADLEEQFRPLGFQTLRAHQTRDAIQHLEQRHGLDQVATTLGAMTDPVLLQELELIPGISRKTALCVMLYSFGRDAFPVDAHTARILQRTGVLDAAGLKLGGLDQKQIQLLVEETLPPSTRGSFHVNAVHHGQTLCLERDPRCGTCPLQLLCQTGRERARVMAEEREHLSLVDMFCGAGGLSEGFRQAGYRTVLAVDADEHAMRTYRLNHPEVDEAAMLCRDIRGFRDEAEEIRAIVGDRQIDVLVGGPPCQGFSRAGLRAKAAHGAPQATDDDRNHLYQELVDLLEVLEPRAIVMENVPGMAEVRYADGTTFVQAAQSAMHAAGYETCTWLLNAAAYGVAQDRIRRIIVGVRGGPAPTEPPPPVRRAMSTSHREDTRSDDMNLPEAVTLLECIGDLPTLGAAQGVNIAGFRGGLLTGHVSRYNNAEDLERFRELRPGESYRKLVERCPWLEIYSTESFPDKFYKLPGDRPSRTIVAHLQRDGNGFVHPAQLRSITPREAARLQSFPDSYLFTGPFTKVYRQIGNAVPPLMAEAIGRHLKQHLLQLDLAEEQ